MARVRSLHRSVRTGALLAGIPLLLTGFVPYALDPLVFSWQLARGADHLAPLIVPAAGLMITATALVPGIGRLTRAVLHLIFIGVALVFVADLAWSQSGFGGLLASSTDGQLVSVEALFKDTHGALLVASLLTAAITELVMQGKKASKVFAAVAVVGWGFLLAQLFIPSAAGDMPISQLASIATGLGDLSVVEYTQLIPMALVILLALAGFLFAVVRLFRGAHGMVSGPFRSGWAGTLVAGSVGWVPLVAGIGALVTLGSWESITTVFNLSALYWGLGLGLCAAVAHTFIAMTMAVGAQHPMPSLRVLEAPVGRPRKRGPVSHQPQPPVGVGRPSSGPVSHQPQPPVGVGRPSSGPVSHQPQPVTPGPTGGTGLAAGGRLSGDHRAQVDGGGASAARPVVSASHQKQVAPQPPALDSQPSSGGGYGPSPHPDSSVQQPRVHQLKGGRPKTLHVSPVAGSHPLGLQPYPGYPGYFVCPNLTCRAGVALSDEVCRHCGGNLR